MIQLKQLNLVVNLCVFTLHPAPVPSLCSYTFFRKKNNTGLALKIKKDDLSLHARPTLLSGNYPCLRSVNA